MKRAFLLSILVLCGSFAGTAVAQENPAPTPAEPAPEPVVPAAEPAPEPAPPVVEEEDSSSFEFVASIFSRFELRRGYDALGLPGPARLRSDQDAVYYRTRVGVVAGAFEVSEALEIKLHFVPQASGFWHVGGDQLVDAQLGLHEGFMTIISNWFALDVGRFELKYGDLLFVGNVGWHQTGRAFDGARFRISPEGSKYWIDVFYTYLVEGFAEGFDDELIHSGDQHFAGIYASFGEAIREGLSMDLYAFTRFAVEGSQTDAMGVTTTSTTWVREFIGLRAKQRLTDWFDYRAETGVQFGKDAAENDIFAFHANVEIGFDFLERFRIGLEGFYASGDDPETDTNEAFNDFFPTAHKFMGFADIVPARSNITGGIFRVVAKLGQGWILKVDGHLFVRAEDTVTTDPTDPTVTNVMEAGYAGAEVDTGIIWKVGGGLKVRTNYSVFIPSEDFYNTFEAAHYWAVELRYDY